LGRTKKRAWRHSLYARATLFLILGAGAVLGAAFVLSSLMVDDSVGRLLGERMGLARTAGVFLEDRIHNDLKNLETRVAPVMRAGRTDTWNEELTLALLDEYGTTLFSEGVFVLDRTKQMTVDVPSVREDLEEAHVDLERLASEAEVSRGMVSTPLVELGHRKVLVMVMPVGGQNGRPVDGYIGGLLQPAAMNILAPLSRARADTGVELDLVDRKGVVVASTAQHGLFRYSDHNRVLAEAIDEGAEIEGQCHSCHEQAGGEIEEPQADILAFSPLPSMGLGLAVHQPESEALAPAFALRKQLFVVGLAFVALFLLFAGLSVRAVVRPVTRLTEAVREDKDDVRPLVLPSTSHDEVGELATALLLWRQRMLLSMRSAERSREALDVETENTRRHLEALEDIVVQSSAGGDMQAIVEHGLEETLSLLGLPEGILQIRYRERVFTSTQEITESQVTCLLEVCRHVFEAPAGADQGPTNEYRMKVLELSKLTLPCCLGTTGMFTAAVLRGSPDFSLIAVVGDKNGKTPAEERWLRSLLQHITMWATNRLRRELDQERQEQNRQYLHRVLKAQEAERRRVARELHDTVAQDLAALRLEVERLGNHAESAHLKAELATLEGRVQENLRLVRNILLDLRLSVLESMGFLPTLQWHLERVEREQGVRGTLEIDGDERELDYETAITLFRIFQESVLNAVQHGKAEHIMVSVLFGESEIKLVVEDDGCGFDPNAYGDGPVVAEHGLGLLGLKERARLLGGLATISSSPGEGTTVTVTAPLHRDASSIGNTMGES